MGQLTQKRCQEIMDRAKKTIPGGINSYARKFDTPLSFKHGSGSKIYDFDENEYIDYLNAWGAIILGHSHEQVNERVAAALEDQDLYGFGTTDLEIEAAEAIKQRVPSADKVLFGVVGSEVVARAVTLARAVTGRRKLIKFQGHYHGWYDPVALNHQSDPEKLGELDPYSNGVLEEAIDETIVLPFNDEDAVREAFEEHGDEIAGIILEPVAHNMGCVVPADGYLQFLRDITHDYGSLLIFDEIITGFRHAMGGIQELEGVTPDLTTMGKSVANGYPISILCGKEEYMNRFHTVEGGDVAYGGTYNAHAGSTAAVLETVNLLETENFHRRAENHVETLCAGIEDHIEDIGIEAHTQQYGTVFLTYFTNHEITDYEDVLASNTDQYLRYRWEMIDRGIMMVPKTARRNYLTASHTDEDIERTLEAAESALKEVAE